VAGFGPISADNRRVARTPVVWFKACPFVMAVCIGLILVGSSL
jgi:hypothetical protein